MAKIPSSSNGRGTSLVKETVDVHIHLLNINNPQKSKYWWIKTFFFKTKTYSLLGNDNMWTWQQIVIKTNGNY